MNPGAQGSISRLLQGVVDLVHRLGHWGYLVVGVVVALECQAVLGLFMPAESLVLVAGFMAGQGVLQLDVLVAVVAVAAIVGDSVGYELGRKLGRGWLRRRGRWFGIRESHLRKVDDYFRRRGARSVFFSHFLHVLRPVMPFLAGAGELPYPKFLLFNALGCILWATLFALLGYFFGDHWDLLEKWIGRAGGLVGAALVLVVAIVWLWRWLAGHELELRQQWALFIERPRVAAFRRRFDRQIRFLERRLTPEGFLGLYLTVGAVAIIVGVWIFAAIAEDVVTQDPLVRVDRRIALWFAAHATARATAVARAITFLGSPPFVGGAAIALALWFLWRRQRYRLLGLLAACAGGGLLDLTLKAVFHRHRPGIHPLVVAGGYAFPSGHAMGSTIFYVFLAWTVAISVRRWKRRVLAFLVGLTMVLLVGFSRIYLGVHFLSDILGAMAAGLAWLAFCLTAVETLRRYRGRPPRPPAAAPPRTA